MLHTEEIECIIGGTEDSRLIGSKLETILNTLSPVTTSFRPHETIITANHGRNLYIHELDKPLRAYQDMLEATTDEITNIWANYSPCPSCVRKLLSHYNKEEDNKPKIHVARIYTNGEELSQIVTSLECLGKLANKGFEVVPWNFNTFRDVSFLTDECKSIINEAYKHENFTSTYMELDSLVTFINELGDSTHASSWCEA